jgi:DNA repair exonuclease SbcCD ATPase subunit
MNALKFRYAGAWNFLPFGPKGVEFYFDDYGKVVLVTGENLDTGTERNPANNGCGKSSIQDILSYAIYGKPVKEPKKLSQDALINKTTGKQLLVDVQFDDYRIVRGRAPNKLDVWHSKDHIWDKTTKITKGAGLQEYIEGIVGLSHIAFCNVVVFDDSNTYSFLKLATPDKRLVIENLFGLDRYRSYQESAKAVVKAHKELIRDCVKELESLQQAVTEADGRIVKVKQQQEVWVNNKQIEIKTLQDKLAIKQKNLVSYDGNVALVKYNDAQKKAPELSLIIEDLKQKRDKNLQAQKAARDQLGEFRKGLRALEDDLQKHRLEYNRLRTETSDALLKINSLQNLKDGTTCPTCNGIVSKENYNILIRHQRNVAETSEAGYRKEEQFCKEASEKIEKRKANIAKVEDMIGESENKTKVVDLKISSTLKEMNELLSIPKPEMGEQERALEVEIVAIKRQIEEKQGEINGISPYKEILEHTVIERQAKIDKSLIKTEELKDAEKLLPYKEWWVDAFGDKGIRKHLIEKVIPALNSRIAYWLQYLIDSKIQLSFDNELNETITRNGVEAEYPAMSNGEKRRINLAVSQAFAYVMMIDSGRCPSLVFLDEITGGGIDTAGVTGIYNMIYELAKERQVLVTTHNQALLHMLEGCETIKLVKNGDITTLVK